jgi:type I restriction enzyme M protein
LNQAKFPTLVIDAKAPDEDVGDWVPQCASYSLEINRQFEHNPVEYFMLTNGLKTVLYKWDQKDPLLEMGLDEFADGNEKFARLKKLIAKEALKKVAAEKLETLMESSFVLRPIELDKLMALFARLHKFIWKTDKKTASPAFKELMKVVFVKIKKDRELHEKHDVNSLKTKDVVFSVAWIKSQTENDNPINDPLFRNLVRDLEKEILKEEKRRIFDDTEHIALNSSTILRIVQEFEHIDFYRMEEDVHGRMFEIFLDATVRGKELGQFFTPRDIVELMVKLADIKVSKSAIESVLDPACGSAGFLIAAMQDMRRKADKIPGLSSRERKEMHKKIDNTALFGIDAGSDPPIHRIARMNMYLHGDGGSNIFFADSIDKRIGQVGPSGLAIDKEISELRNLLLAEGRRFDVILSNPPFSMSYSRDHDEQGEILDKYDVAHIDKQAKSMMSSVMFLERYKDLVTADGRILAVIDESVLSGEVFGEIRKFIRKTFIIQAIISLPGDAFRRSAARVKTSVLIVRPKRDDEEQGDVFMEKSVYLGLSLKTARRIGISRAELEQGKAAELERIVGSFKKFQNGKQADYVLPASSVADRLDVKNCLGDAGRRKQDWKDAGYDVLPLSDVLKLASGRSVAVDGEESYRLLKVTYEGEVLEADHKFGDELSYTKLNRVEPWDVVFSNISIGRGSVGIVPDYLAGHHVSNEYTIVTAATKEEAVFYSNVLRSKEFLGDILTSTTGLNRSRMRWGAMGKLHVPVCKPKSKQLEKAVRSTLQLWAARGEYEATMEKEIETLARKLHLDDDEAKKRWLAFKPPE